MKQPVSGKYASFLQEALIGLPGGLQGRWVMLAVEELRLTVEPEGCPVAADDAVTGDDGLEDAAVVVRLVAIIGREDDVAALVTDKVFVIRRNQEVSAFAETMGAAIVRKIKFPALL